MNRFVLVFVALAVSGCAAPDDVTQPAEPANDLPVDASAFGDTPATYFPQHVFEIPGPGECEASTKADADYSCSVEYTAVGLRSPQVTTLEFDRWGKLVRSAGENPSEFEYDCDGNLIRALSGPVGQQFEVVHTYDAGRLIRTVSTDADGGEDASDYIYDTQGRTESVTRTTSEYDGGTVIVTTTYEYGADGELAAEVRSDGERVEYWTDSAGVQWHGDPAPGACAFGTRYDDAGLWVEDHTRDCPAFGEGHRVVRMKRDKYHRPEEVTDHTGAVIETHSYEGANPYPSMTWKAFEGSSLGAVTSTFRYEHTTTSLTITATDDESALPAGAVTFNGVPCFPEEDGLRRGWLWQLASP